MGSFVEVNDTLQITFAQGFPTELDLEAHRRRPFKTEDFKGRVFEFYDKPNIRIYHAPPVRTFLVQNIDGKWLHWGTAHILTVKHDLVGKKTSGSFEIVRLYSPEEMLAAQELMFASGDDKKYHLKHD